jgi:hypothetical protein
MIEPQNSLPDGQQFLIDSQGFREIPVLAGPMGQVVSRR